MQLYLNELAPMEAYGPRLAKHPQVAAALKAAQPHPCPAGVVRFVRVAVCQRRAEVVFRKLNNGPWEHRCEYVDHVFGHINQRYQPLPEGVA